MSGFPVIDLRSDTVTAPSPGMREAMARADVGDDVYGEDPTVTALEERSAEIMGKEAGLFVPSGSQANLISLLVHVPRGEEVVAGAESHCIRFEAGSGAALAGVQYSMIPGDGRFTARDLEAHMHERSLHTPGTALVWIENTHNMGGGTIFPFAETRAVSDLAHGKGIPVHVDGARIMNAAVATGIPAREWASLADSISFCLSKGLGAPVGSVLTGTRPFVDRARRFRKMLGGAMRQAGVLAAAGMYALDHNVDRLAEDHAAARALAEGLATLPGIAVDPGSVETNIVMAASRGADARKLAKAAAVRGILFHAFGPARMRFVTHLDVPAIMIPEALRRLREALAA